MDEFFVFPTQRNRMRIPGIGDLTPVGAAILQKRFRQFNKAGARAEIQQQKGMP
jgi:hypothetical protein